MATFKEIADRVSQDVWGFEPSRQVKPVHFANGFARAISGQAGSSTLLQKAAGGFLSGRSRVKTEQFIADAGGRFRGNGDASSLERARGLRAALDLVLNQDRAMFGTGSYWSPTLTHRLHTTTDPSDRGTGAFLAKMLAAAEDRTVIDVLRRSLNSNTDNVYFLTAPLLSDRDMGTPPAADPEMVERVKRSPILQSIQAAFATVVRYEARLEKTMFLQRVVTLGSFALFLHLVNRAPADQASRATNGETGVDSGFVPILLCSTNPHPEVREASRSAFRIARREVERAFEDGLAHVLRSRGQDRCTKEEYLAHRSQVK